MTITEFATGWVVVISFARHVQPSVTETMMEETIGFAIKMRPDARGVMTT